MGQHRQVRLRLHHGNRLLFDTLVFSMETGLAEILRTGGAASSDLVVVDHGVAVEGDWAVCAISAGV